MQVITERLGKEGSLTLSKKQVTHYIIIEHLFILHHCGVVVSTIASRQEGPGL